MTSDDRATEFMPVTAAVIRVAGRILVASRPPGKHLAGHWEFPGGKPHADESFAGALRRELREELGGEIIVLDLLWRERHRYPTHAVDLHFFRCLLQSPQDALAPREGQQLAWVDPAGLAALPLVPADLPFANWLRLAAGFLPIRPYRNRPA